ncbi:hypothetical protein AAMO2058_000450500 [Amorphochlora amoebiformis]|uniref:3-dehydroquinate synthase domain-containing protein n=1 Tax=Amorphochlora amoebiformis TaxID=1561963 RepID=A0A7S0DNG1_9EUKA|mmetsp:Transcript_3567/g.5483  ORF Transcript_3567/g.5483 Transcript_3567/m.5483 type:complete len:458 (+) Transcript_3567:461-1834(+)
MIALLLMLALMHRKSYCKVVPRLAMGPWRVGEQHDGLSGKFSRDVLIRLWHSGRPWRSLNVVRGEVVGDTVTGNPGREGRIKEDEAGGYVIEIAGKSRVMLKSGLTNRIPRLLSEAFPKAYKFVVVTDNTVYDIHGKEFCGMLQSHGLEPIVIRVPSGEHSKTRKWKAYIEDEMILHGCGRDSVLIAFGGGVVGDLGGFVAATYMRGIPVVQIPTTVMAIVDSSVGGKTAINLESGKNLIGAFHHPALVFADVDFLDTLSPNIYNEGVAEIIKMGLVRSLPLFETLESTPTIRDAPASGLEAIAWAVKLKAEVVEIDEVDKGVRSTLNFGHTVGHAIEAEASLAGGDASKMLHGECVAIGMLVELRAAALEERWLSDETDEILGRLTAVLKKYDLPTSVPHHMSAQTLLSRMSLDKKNLQGKVFISKLDGIGKARPIPEPISEEAMLHALGEFGASP